MAKLTNDILINVVNDGNDMKMIDQWWTTNMKPDKWTKWRMIKSQKKPDVNIDQRKWHAWWGQSKYEPQFRLMAWWNESQRVLVVILKTKLMKTSIIIILWKVFYWRTANDERKPIIWKILMSHYGVVIYWYEERKEKAWKTTGSHSIEEDNEAKDILIID